MDLHEFRIGRDFMMSGKRYRCTDIGTRTVVAIRVEPFEIVTVIGGEKTTRVLDASSVKAGGWLNGPPYAVAETVIDEDDRETCEPIEGE